LLITLLLVERQVLTRPLLYLSLYLKQNRTEYYDRLTAIRERGDWEGWLRFFLTGVAVIASDATAVAAALTDLRAQHLRIAAAESFGRYGFPLLDLLTEQPLVTVGYVVEHLGASPTTIGALLDKATKLGMVEEITGQRRNRVYRYSPFLDLFTPDEPGEQGVAGELWLGADPQGLETQPEADQEQPRVGL
ncbi:MAG TPA: hypothetical protein VJR05_04275, partial [Acidimicrobiia bacterium]|nr:hypothetical protein [Acidimicrobiia bacterium]